MTRDPLQHRPDHEWFFATMRDITATTCRYQREDTGQIGGPIAYQRLRAVEVVAVENDGGDNATDHLHDRHSPPPEGTRCAVLIVGGRMEAGMAFPEIIS